MDMRIISGYDQNLRRLHRKNFHVRINTVLFHVSNCSVFGNEFQDRWCLNHIETTTIGERVVGSASDLRLPAPVAKICSIKHHSHVSYRYPSQESRSNSESLTKRRTQLAFVVAAVLLTSIQTSSCLFVIRLQY